MRSPFRTRGFERRLVVFFLLLSLPPTLLIALVSTRYFMQSIRLVSNPTVEQSFTSSMEIARDFSAKLEEDSHCAAVRLRDEFERAGRPAPGPALQQVLAKVSVETHTDFTAVYLPEGDSWLLKQAYPHGFSRLDPRTDLSAAGPPDTSETSGAPAAGVAPGPTRTPADLSPTHRGAIPAADPGTATTSSLDLSDPDVVASGIVGDGILFVAGYALDQGFAEKMRRTGDDLGRYRAVGLYVSVMRRYIMIATSVLVVLIAVASALFSRAIAKRISQPITELAHATERVAKGDLDHRVTVAARDEVASLVTGFNRMTEELQENKRNLIRAERIAAWRDVARRIAHEIKNPLTPIEIAIYRIKKRLEAPAPTQDRAASDRHVIEESLDSILKEVTALKTIAQEFSSFAKLPEPKPESLDINDILKSVLELYASSSQQVEIKTRLKSPLPLVMADRDQMRSVFSNLVKNAFEAMPSGGTLTVTTTVMTEAAGARAATDTAATTAATKATALKSAPDAAKGSPAKPSPAGAGHVRVEIADTGAGIPEEIREKVFDPYFTTKPSGTGVGLALAYRILADHHAKISFRTGAAGTSFIVDLPVGTQA